MLVIIETHPVQYHAPVYREVQQQFGVPVTAVYGSDFSISGYRDKGFGVTFSWDTDLTSGYACVFLTRSKEAGKPFLAGKSVLKLKEYLCKLKPKAILLTGYAPLLYRVAFYQAYRRNIPVIFRAETMDIPQGRALVRKLLRDPLLRWLYARCAKILYIGENSRRHYRRLGCPEDKLFFSPYCVDTGSFAIDEENRPLLRRQTRAGLGIEDSEIALIFSGKLIRRKRPDLILSAVRSLAPELRKKIAVIFLGDGDLKNSLQRAAKKAPEIKAFFIGFQNQTKLSRYYLASDLLVFPSSYEPWGLAVNEALYHGVPCVVSRTVSCSLDLIEPGVTGEISEAGSKGSLAAAIKRGITLTGREDIRKRCRQKVSGYTVNKAALGIVDAYEGIVSKDERAKT